MGDPIPIDPVAQAERLARILFDLSNAVDNFRLDHADELAAEKKKQLKEQAQALDTRAQEATGAAMAAVVAKIQPHLQNIQKAGKDAEAALAHLNDVAKGLAIVDAAVALVGSIAAGDLPSVGDGVQGLLQAINS